MYRVRNELFAAAAAALPLGPTASTASAPDQVRFRDGLRQLVLPALAVTLLWGLARSVFFQGFWGDDDFFYMRFATLWQPPPTNHLEVRLFFNGLLRVTTRVLGTSQLAWAVPTLAASLITLISSMFLGFKYAGRRGMLAAGLLAATLPMDVLFSTTPNASPFAAGLAALATLLLLSGSGVLSLAAATFVASLAILAHTTTVFYFLCLAAACFVFVNKSRAATFGVAAVALFFALDFFTSYFVAGDPLIDLRILSAWHDPDISYTLYSWGWFVAPVIHFFFSKEFGFAVLACLLLVVFVPVVRGRPELRAMAGTGLLTWLWFAYGTARPTNYEPFWRSVRFNQPLEIVVAALIAVGLAALPRRRFALALAALCLCNVALISASGSYGQRDDISAQFLPFVRSHSNAVFYTEALTARDLSMWNSFRPLSNVRVIYNANLADTRKPKRPMFLLDNPLGKTPTDLANRPEPNIKVPTMRLSPPLLRTPVKYRDIAAVLPASVLGRFPFLVRRPSGTIREILEVEPGEFGSGRAQRGGGRSGPSTSQDTARRPDGGARS